MKQEPIEITAFARELLKKQKCPFCEAAFGPLDVTAQGNRRGKDGKSYYYYETQCGECNQPSMSVVTSRAMDTRGLMSALIEHYKEEGAQDAIVAPQAAEPSASEPETPPPLPPKPSGITDAEVEKAKQMLDKAKTFYDVMRGLGISDETIERIMTEGKAKDDRDDKGK